MSDQELTEESGENEPTEVEFPTMVWTYTRRREGVEVALTATVHSHEQHEMAYEYYLEMCYKTGKLPGYVEAKTNRAIRTEPDPETKRRQAGAIKGYYARRARGE